MSEKRFYNKWSQISFVLLNIDMPFFEDSVDPDQSVIKKLLIRIGKTLHETC